VRASAPAASPAAARNSAPERSHGFRRFLLKAAAIFILFDFVITDDPGRMSGRLVEAVESMVDPHPGLHRPTAITDVSERDAARPVPTPSPEPLTVAVSTETQEAARAFNVSASRVREVENLSLPPGWSRISVEEYHGVAIDGLIRDGEYRYHVRRTDGTHASLREARKAIRIERLARKSEVKHELVISRYDRADLDHDDELSWRELRKFQEAVFRDFRYESNGKALRPEEFFLTGGGDCEDFAIFSAAMLTYWGWDAYVASMGTNDNDAHAVVFIKVDRPPAWASFYEIPKGTGNPRFAASGTFVPVDYDVVGGLSNAVTPGSTVTDIVVPRAWYGLAI
jgi:predicted transglutaminase-like cysteine proteinase